MVLQHTKKIVAAGLGDALEGPALREKCWKRYSIAGGSRAIPELGRRGQVDASH